MSGDQNSTPPARVALYYDDEAYRETSQRGVLRPGEQAGLMGRQVAGQEFLNAYLAYGSWTELIAVVPQTRSRESLLATCVAHPSSRHGPRRLQTIDLQEFRAKFAREAPADVLHFPCPPDVRFAWCRQSLGGHPFALCGVTHTLCSQSAVEALCQMVTGPWETYDRLICTSQSVIDMARAVTDTYAAYLQDRFGGQPTSRIGFERVPLGVDVEKYQPARPEERARERQRWQIADDELVVLFVGRFAHHAKAHPFPMYRALAEAARHTGRRLRLLLAGWASLPAVLDAFRDGAQRFAPHVQTTVLDGNRPEVRLSVWKAADIFTSLSDNIQETFGLVIAEAMASGLPVVASDWNGYRDLVVSGETGLLVPTLMVRDATAQVTSQLLLGEINYDHFLARCNQCVTVDAAATTEAFVRLIENAGERQRMGEAARQRACRQFAWSRVIGEYESLWRQQAGELAERRTAGGVSSPGWPALYPAPERSFAGYPSRWLDERSQLRSGSDALDQLVVIATLPLTNYEASQRCVDQQLLRQLLIAARDGCALGELDELLYQAGVPRSQSRATIAWLLKYDLLRALPDS